MDFFASQDRARRNTWLLLFYSALAIVGLVVALWGLATLAAANDRSANVPPWRPDILLAVSLFTLFVVFCGSLYKTWQLRVGGECIARQLGGRPVLANTPDIQERRLLNVVEEMALATGIPPPPVYILDEEMSINAFAAGYSPADAVIGVNRGTLMYLNRDELQGVIAHEFSHILNGDMRLNLRLIGLVHGILVIALIGYYMMKLIGRSRHRRSRNDMSVYVFLVGLVLYLIGSIGVFFGRLIKAAISRQREYLADAAAVQFTRYPDGIAGALKKIGGLAIGSRMNHPAAEEASHMFFSMGFRTFFAPLFATHPPLVSRIRRIDPKFNGVFPRVVPLDQLPLPEEIAGAAQRVRTSKLQTMVVSNLQQDQVQIDVDSVLASFGQFSQAAADYLTKLLEQLPADLQKAKQEPFEARCLVFAMLWEKDESVAALQERIVLEREGEPTLTRTLALRSLLAQCPDAVRLPLLQCAQTTLRQMSQSQYHQFRGTVAALVQADRKITLREFVLQHILLTHLDRHFINPIPPRIRYRSVKAIPSQVHLLLSLVTHISRVPPERAEDVFRTGCAAVGIEPTVPLLPLQECTLAKIEQAMHKLRSATPTVKKKLLIGMFTIATADQRITTYEAELLRAIAEAIDCPAPPIVATQLGTS